MNFSATPTDTIPASRTTLSDHGRNITDVAGKFSPWILVIPAALTAWIGTQTAHPLWQYTRKPYQEILGPSILAVAAVLSVAVWLKRRNFYHRWLAILSVGLFCREIDFQGASTGIYITVALLTWYASCNIESMKPYTENRLLVTLFVGAFITYFAAITVDRAVWKFLPHHRLWRDSIEETLESLGHLMILSVIISSAFVRRTHSVVQSNAIPDRDSSARATAA